MSEETFRKVNNTDKVIQTSKWPHYDIGEMPYIGDKNLQDILKENRVLKGKCDELANDCLHLIEDRFRKLSSDCFHLMSKEGIFSQEESEMMKELGQHAAKGKSMTIDLIITMNERKLKKEKSDE